MFDLYQFAIRNYWTAIGDGRISRITVRVAMWKSVPGRERAGVGFAANPDLRTVCDDPAARLPCGNVRGAEACGRGDLRHSSLARAMTVLSVLVVLVVLFALECRLVLTFVRAWMHSLPVWQHLGRR